MRNIAPWPDADGHEIIEGDRMSNSEGDTGIVVFKPAASADAERWLLDYGSGAPRSLFAELTGAARAIIVDETGKFQ